MMFNGLMMCGDSDTSDFAKESASSGVDAGAGAGAACDAARALYYHNKLLATLQILANKEETVRVQAQSLAVAEARIAALAERAARARADLHQATQELRTLRNSKKDCCRDVNKTEVAEVEKQKNIVRTLRTNLSVIEDLYRECFYETAKQEELVDMLRKSYLDVRLLEKEKCDQIGRLQNVINTQKWSLDRCQDIAVDVENLKLEIWSFLSNSNNDSGVWERSEDSLATEVGDDLHHIVDQLVQLRDMLTCECTCGLADENKQLKELNDAMQRKVEELCAKVCDMETTVQERDVYIQQMKETNHEKEEQLLDARQQVQNLEDREKQRSCQDDCLKVQLQQMQVLLKDQSEELERVQQRCAASEAAAGGLRRELEAAGRTISESGAVRGEVAVLREQVAEWRAQLERSEGRARGAGAELQRARDHCRALTLYYREQERCAAGLHAQLSEAQARGAALCCEARRVVAAARRWLRDMRAAARAQEEKINEQRILISSLERQLSDKETEAACLARDVGCSKCARRRRPREADDSAAPSTSRYTTGRSESGKASCECPRASATSGSERAGESAPAPPRALLRKKLPICIDNRCAVRRRRPEAGTQQPARGDVGTAPARAAPRVQHMRAASVPAILREASPGEELLQRVEALHGALDAGARRWARASPPRQHHPHI